METGSISLALWKATRDFEYHVVRFWVLLNICLMGMDPVGAVTLAGNLKSC